MGGTTTGSHGSPSVPTASARAWDGWSDVPHITARVRSVPARNVIVLTVGCR
jgi:hypothetical protein